MESGIYDEKNKWVEDTYEKKERENMPKSSKLNTEFAPLDRLALLQKLRRLELIDMRGPTGPTGPTGP